MCVTLHVGVSVCMCVCMHESEHVCFGFTNHQAPEENNGFSPEGAKTTADLYFLTPSPTHNILLSLEWNTLSP